VTALSAAHVGPGKPSSAGLACPDIPRPTQRREAKARASCAVPRTSSARAGILRAVAGLIIKNVAFKHSQCSPVAAATANIVVIAIVTSSSMAIMACLPASDLWNRTARTNLNMLMRKDLQNGEAHESVGTITHRVAPDAPRSGAQAYLGKVGSAYFDERSKPRLQVLQMGLLILP
jgi:hypothetical protein